jgi:Effector-associated domain 11
MPDEFKICAYQSLYDWIKKNSKKDFSYDLHVILRQHEAILHFTPFSLPLYTTAQELNKFVNTYFYVTFEQLCQMCAAFNDKIKLGSQLTGRGFMPDTLQNAYNIYQSLLTVRQCLNDYGFLVEEIMKRKTFHFFHFIVKSDKNGKKQTNAHYNIGKNKLDEYIEIFNKKESMRLNGKYVAFYEENDIYVIGTKLNTEVEIEQFKKRRRISNDAEFAKSFICKDLTSEFVSAKLDLQSQKMIESSQPNINLIDNTIEAKMIDIGNKNIQGDQIINYNFGVDENKLKNKFVTQDELKVEAAKAAKLIDGIMPDLLEVKDKLTQANSTLEKHNQELSKSVLNLTQTNQDLTKSVSGLVSLNPETAIIKDEKTKISNLKSNVTQLIKKGKTQEAIELLFDEAEKHNWTECINDLTLLFGRFHRLKATKNKATGYNENMIVEHNQIDEALQSLVNDLEI